MQVLSYYQRNKDRIKDKARQTKLTGKDGKTWNDLRKRPRPHHCELCHHFHNENGRPIRLEYHHWINEYPEIGLWLCYKCHHFAEYLDRSGATMSVSIYYTLKREAEQNFHGNLT